MLPDEIKLPVSDHDPSTVELGKPQSTVSISLKYWQSRSQCLSDWRQSELLKLRKLIDRVQRLTVSELKNDSGLGWTSHKGPPGHGFTRHTELSKDVPLFEMRVDGKARVHGALLEDVFYLVWLDRNHGVFPSGK